VEERVCEREREKEREKECVNMYKEIKTENHRKRRK
jgi:hypothetical protein